MELKLFPNPATDVVNVSFQLQDAADAIVTVTDALGHTVMESGVAYLDGGENHVKINATSLPSGFYFVNLHVAGTFATQRLVVQ